MSTRVKRSRLFTALAIAVVWTLALTHSAAVETPAVATGGSTSAIRSATDDWGVPHVYANNDADLFHGFGYVQARDRLYQIETMKRTALGTVAEVFGQRFVAHDVRVREMLFSTDEVEQRLAALAPHEREWLQAYADGVNRRIAEVLDQPDKLLPQQFTQFGFEPEPWSAVDVAQVWIFQTFLFFAGGLGEVQNQARLNGLINEYGEDDGRAIFDDVFPLVDCDVYTTIPIGDWPPDPACAQSQEVSTASTGDRTFSEVAIQEMADRVESERVASVTSEDLPIVVPEEWSNAWVVGPELSETGQAMFLGGPQVGHTAPSYLHEVGLHSPGFNVVGTAIAGVPAVFFGHNDHITWSVTAGVGNFSDSFVEELHPEDPNRYRFGDDFLEMDIREEIVEVAGGDPVVATSRRTVHGPVLSVDPENNVAFSVARSWEGLELETIMGWIASTQATDWDSHLEALRRSAISVNHFYADRDGNIGFMYAGRYPQRHPDQDPRLPTPGTGEREWTGFIPPEDVPHVLNPSTGYIANWNAQPAQGYVWGRQGPVTRDARLVRYLDQNIEEHGTISAETSMGLVEHSSLHVGISHVDLNFREPLMAALDSADLSEDAKAGRELVEEWDGLGFKEDDDGEGFHQPPGRIIIQEWFGLLRAAAFEGWFPPETGINPSANLLFHVIMGDETAMTLSQDYLRGRSPDEVMVEAFEDAIANLLDSRGDDMASWTGPGQPMNFPTFNPAGVPQGGEFLQLPQFMNRGSQNHFVLLDGDGISGVNVSPPGNSAFIAPDGQKDPHFSDQMSLYEAFEYKPMRLARRDVNQSAVAHKVLPPCAGAGMNC